MDAAPEEHAPLLRAMSNLTHFHREHEKFYGAVPRESAVLLQRHARTLQALADRWSWVAPVDRAAFSPYEGAPDLNAETAIQLDGVLFLEGEGEPAEITRIKRDLRNLSDDAGETGAWLAQAMERSWAMGKALLDIDGVADLLGERHHIISNDWLAANMSSVTARIVERAIDILDRVDYSPKALRADLKGARLAAARLYSASELLDRAADLYCESSALVHENERHWRTFHTRVESLIAASETAGDATESAQV